MLFVCSGDNKTAETTIEESGLCGKTILLCETNIIQSIKKSIKKHD
jgi:hypothetical protein